MTNSTRPRRRSNRRLRLVGPTWTNPWWYLAQLAAVFSGIGFAIYFGTPPDPEEVGLGMGIAGGIWAVLLTALAAVAGPDWTDPAGGGRP